MKYLCLVTFLFSIYGCNESRPLSNTPEHKSAHGYLEGESTYLWVGKTLLKIPDGVSFNPVTQGRIEKGRADRVTLDLNYPEISKNFIVNRVPVTLRGGGYEVPRLWDKHLEREKWKSIKENTELGLREYHRERYDGAWGYITYLAINDIDKTPKGSLIRFRCTGYPVGEVDECLGEFVAADELYVQYKISGSLVPHWRRVHSDVVKLVKSIVAVKEYSNG